MRYEVTDNDTAAAMGSGDVPVLATPRLIAWLEAATVRAATALIGQGQTTVGVAVRVRHRRATAVGGIVDVSADAHDDTDGRTVTFSVAAHDHDGQIVADGEIDRAIVAREKFVAALDG